MTNAHQSAAPAPRGNPVGVVMIAVGALMLIGGVVGRYAGFWIGAVVAILGAILLGVGIVVEVTQRRARRGAPRWSRSARVLLGTGIVLAAVGLIGGAVARWSADRDSTRLLTSGGSQTINAQLELTFPEPDYTLFWIFMAVAAVGVIAVVASILHAHAQHLTSGSVD
jgi:hypothetical protein